MHALSPIERRWAEIYFAEAHEQDFVALPDADLIAHIQHTVAFFSKRNGKTPAVRVFTPAHCPHSLVEIIMDDQPFVLDTVWVNLQAMHVKIHASLHPMFATHRDETGKLAEFAAYRNRSGLKNLSRKEVLIHVFIGRQAGPHALETIQTELERALNEAQMAVRDFGSMHAVMEKLADDIATHTTPAETARQDELAFLRWLLAGDFIFLGYRHYHVKGVGSGQTMELDAGSGLGILRNDATSSVSTPTSLDKLPRSTRQHLAGEGRLILTKSLTKARVHRIVDMDYVGLKTFDRFGRVVGEHRFLGLYTSKAYTTPARQIPFVARKIERVLESESGNGTDTYNYRTLTHVLDTFPRDELFQMTVPDLHRIATGIVELQERPQVRAFIRHNTDDDLLTVLVYLPIERMSTAMRHAIQKLLLEQVGGLDAECVVNLGEAAHARLYYKVRLPINTEVVLTESELTKAISTLTRLWRDDVYEALLATHGEAVGLRRFEQFVSCFPTSYQERADMETTLADIDLLATWPAHEQVRVSVHASSPMQFSLRVFRKDAPLALSAILPILSDLNLQVMTEHPHPLHVADETYWLHDFSVRLLATQQLTPERADVLIELLTLTLKGHSESDALGGLVLAIGLNVAHIERLRAVVAYMQQIRSRYPARHIQATLIKHAPITAQLAALFDARFNPATPNRSTAQETQIEHIKAMLRDVNLLDEDAILSAVLNITCAMVRTNAFSKKAGEPLAFKINPQAVADMPKPVPYREIFVYHPRVEGTHLRGGAVARGGLRWSERVADYRTEVLGLMKTQVVKNTIIVPTGAKGGFILKTPPCDLKNIQACNPAELKKEVVNAYTLYVHALLSVTDNLVSGKPVPPINVVCHDGVDTYLVVAADKGTAHMSDTANKISAEAAYWGGDIRGFWLADAFASGGSNGYDHKKLGITAKGAWECVKHHAQQLGKNPETDALTVVGIGDMSGDVFGNGLLLSSSIKLIAAFDHRHIFLDPTPNPTESFKERERLFLLPASSWADYAADKISKGGGVFPRTQKAIPLSREIQACLGVSQNEISPITLIQAILNAQVDILWNGGIGTYVKATTETHEDVSDRANDDLRVNGKDLRAKIIGEGGNLGFTQKGRIEYALNGGHINTDAVDNSAGVDTSDHEVNIKILLAEAVRERLISTAEVPALIKSLASNVCELVLADNRAQAAVLTRATADGAARNDDYLNLTAHFEEIGQLDASLESLPDAESLHKRSAGFTRPELSILMAAVKTELKAAFMNSPHAGSDMFIPWLVSYFPTPLQQKFKPVMVQHPLRAAIVATQVANAFVNTNGLLAAYAEKTPLADVLATWARANAPSA